ncbi:hypothetical protein SSCG_03868 [Streptomyces clavuligerus]|nr:hypothetical protein SSCG_03868 [Streptomyces clavuligerus]
MGSGFRVWGQDGRARRHGTAVSRALERGWCGEPVDGAGEIRGISGTGGTGGVGQDEGGSCP